MFGCEPLVFRHVCAIAPVQSHFKVAANLGEKIELSAILKCFNVRQNGEKSEQFVYMAGWFLQSSLLADFVSWGNEELV